MFVFCNHCILYKIKKIFNVLETRLDTCIIIIFFYNFLLSALLHFVLNRVLDTLKNLSYKIVYSSCI